MPKIRYAIPLCLLTNPMSILWSRTYCRRRVCTASLPDNLGLQWRQQCILSIVCLHCSMIAGKLRCVAFAGRGGWLGAGWEPLWASETSGGLEDCLPSTLTKARRWDARTRDWRRSLRKKTIRSKRIAGPRFINPSSAISKEPPIGRIECRGFVMAMVDTLDLYGCKSADLLQQRNWTRHKDC